jgi:hypothetical protein
MYSDPGGPPGEEARSRFYEAYKRQSNKFDKELKEYNKELNITLLFVRLVTMPRTGAHHQEAANRGLKSFVCSPPCSL